MTTILYILSLLGILGAMGFAIVRFANHSTRKELIEAWAIFILSIIAGVYLLIDLFKGLSL